MRASASSFNVQYLISLRLSSSCLRLNPRLPFPTLFPLVTSFRSQFLRSMWPFPLAFINFSVCSAFLFSKCTSDSDDLPRRRRRSDHPKHLFTYTTLHGMFPSSTKIVDGLELYFRLPLVVAYESHGMIFTLHGIIIQTTKLFILTAMRTSDFTYCNFALLEFVYLSYYFIMIRTLSSISNCFVLLYSVQHIRHITAGKLAYSLERLDRQIGRACS
jgi:hypothetical protein